MVALVGDGELPGAICCLIALLALAFVAGCSASPEPPFETVAYSAIGAQVK
jgi:hypothetical protein